MSTNHTTHSSHTTDGIMVKFWGVRGSYPVPGARSIGYGGNTACVEVAIDGQTIILDAGTGIIALGRDLAARARQAGQPVEATVLFSHLHHDHTQGFPFFGPAYNPTTRLNLFGPGASEQALEDVLTRNQTPPNFPVTLRDMGAAKLIRSLKESDVILLGKRVGGAAVCKAAEAPADDDLVRIRILRSHAHPGGVYVYRVEWRGQSVVYATDTEGYVGGDRRLVNFARGADLLIHDAQYADEHYCGQMAGLPATQGYGHSTAAMACEVAQAAGVKQLALFHHDPNYDDDMMATINTQAQHWFPNVVAAFEGLEIAVAELTPPQANETTVNHLSPVVISGG
jgi:phosphoribosyl 1,2-cyclic phosphodiesterase